MTDVKLSKSSPDPAMPTDMRGSAIRDFLGRLVREHPMGAAGLLITLALLILGIFADLIAPFGLNETTSNFMSPPSGAHLLGTDNLGRDVFSRIIYGARISLVVGLCATALATFYSVLLGATSGFIGGRFDVIVQRFVDAWMAVPAIIMSLLLISVFGTGTIQTIIVISLALGVGGSRIVRGAVLSIKSNAYVEAGVAIGCSNGRILIRHILPNIAATVVTIFTLRISEAILMEAALSFLGLGLPPPNPSWGAMLSGTARNYMFLAPWMVLWPGIVLMTVVWGMNMFGDALRDLLDPKLRGGVGRFGRRAPKHTESEVERSHAK